MIDSTTLDPQLGLLSQILAYQVQFRLNTLVIMAMDFVKRWEAIPWVRHDTDKLNRAIGWAVAALSGAGVHFAIAWNPDGSWAASLSGPAFGTILTSVMNAGLNVALQQYQYDSRSQPSVGKSTDVSPSAQSIIAVPVSNVGSNPWAPTKGE